MKSKQLIVVGGPNGAGKTTFVEEYLRTKSIPYLGADLIAAELNPKSPGDVAIEAGREFLRRLERHLKGDDSFIVETTLSGKSFRHSLALASENGFLTTVHFIFNDGPDMSVARVLERVRRGGHHVPEGDVRRRYARSLANFWNIYRPLADQWLLTYNGEYGSTPVARGTPYTETVYDTPARERFFKLAGITDDDSAQP